MDVGRVASTLSDTGVNHLATSALIAYPEAQVRPMLPADRLQLAKLILNDLAPPESDIDVSDGWDDDDLADVAAHSARHGGRLTPDAGDGDTSR